MLPGEHQRVIIGQGMTNHRRARLQVLKQRLQVFPEPGMQHGIGC